MPAGDAYKLLVVMPDGSAKWWCLTAMLDGSVSSFACGGPHSNHSNAEIIREALNEPTHCFVIRKKESEKRLSKTLNAKDFEEKFVSTYCLQPVRSSQTFLRF